MNNLFIKNAGLSGLFAAIIMAVINYLQGNI